MKQKSGIQQKIKLITILLGAAVLVVWSVFYWHSATGIRTANEEHIRQVSNQIIERLEVELFGMENLAFTLASRPEVKEFIAEPDPLLFHEKSANVDDLLDALMGTTDFAQNIVMFTTDGVHAGFLGNLGAESSTALWEMFAASPLPRYTSVTLGGSRYIAYGSGIFDQGNQIGTIVLLAEEGRLLGLFSEYITADSLAVSLAENGAVVTSSDSGLVGKNTGELVRASSLYQSSAIGFAPFEVYVSVGEDYMGGMGRDFAFAAILTAALTAAILLVYSYISNRYFIKPMVGVIGEVGRLGVEGEDAQRLSETGMKDFDGLVCQVNLMLERLEEHNLALLSAQSQLQGAEIERQTALIVSLKKQINAHFTVNILSIIKALSEKGEAEKAALMSDGLSRLLRYANDEDELTSGMDEMLVLEKYAAMMEIRYPERFTVEFDWDDRLMDVQMPRMLVQPLMENAIVHGFFQTAGTGKLHVAGGLDGGMVWITVSDNGCGMEEKELERLKAEIDTTNAPVWNVGGTEHVALANIQRRLRSYYGEAGKLRIESKPGGGTTVTLRFPMQAG